MYLVGLKNKRVVVIVNATKGYMYIVTIRRYCTPQNLCTEYYCTEETADQNGKNKGNILIRAK
jgi:hypothetical protein